MAEKTKEFVARKRDTGVSRREFMGTTAKAVAAGSMAASFPFIAKGAESLRTIVLVERLAKIRAITQSLTRNTKSKVFCCL